MLFTKHTVMYVFNTNGVRSTFLCYKYTVYVSCMNILWQMKAEINMPTDNDENNITK